MDVVHLLEECIKNDVTLQKRLKIIKDTTIQ